MSIKKQITILTAEEISTLSPSKLVEYHKIIKGMIDACETSIKAADSALKEICDSMGAKHKESAMQTANGVAWYTDTTTTQFSSTALKAEKPDIYAQYSKVVANRRLFVR